ncbi:cupin domain-containing protein [Baekduia alba]|uniref:cupin domain-containing protein n=1 Tax=Baekduia alba TaxID=2997333 RepID=UPI002342010D|nr:cupin domain-containing protein [Baekduia alba]
MPDESVNILSVELDERLDEAGFRHLAASAGVRLGAHRIRASVYAAEAGVPIWPYHYHHGIEEWLYVIAGAPVLREPAGERTLTPGDLVCFPCGHLGAHTVSGPGRFVIFSTGHDAKPWMTVYPDSDKVSGPGGILLRESAVGYWHGEGTAGPSEPVAVVREPATSPPQPAVNALALPETARLGPLLGADRLDATVADVAPGGGSNPYHYVYGREEWLLVLAGTPSLRHPPGERRLEAGDLVCFPEGPAGAHRLINRDASPVRALFLSTTGVPANVCYPDTRHWLIHNGPGNGVEVRETVVAVNPE